MRNEEEVPDFERQNEYLMLRLRTSDGVELRDLEERYHVDPAPYEAVFRALAKPGLTEQNGTRWHLTDAGFLVSNSIIKYDNRRCFPLNDIYTSAKNSHIRKMEELLCAQ